MSGNAPQNLGIFIEAQLNVNKSQINIEKGLEEIAKKLKPIEVTVNINNSAFDAIKKLADNIDSINKLAKATNGTLLDTVKVIEQIGDKKIITTKQFLPGEGGTFIQAVKEQAVQAKEAIEQVEGAYDNFVEQVSNAGRVKNITTLFDPATGNVRGFQGTAMNGMDSSHFIGGANGEASLIKETENVQKLTDAIVKADVELQDLFDKLSGIDKTGRIGSSGAIQNLQEQILGSLGSGDASKVKQIQKAVADLVETQKEQLSLIKSESDAYDEQDRRAQKALKDQEQYTKELYDQRDKYIQEDIKLVQSMHNTEQMSAQEAFVRLKGIYEQETIYFQENINAQIAMEKQLYDLKQTMLKQAEATLVDSITSQTGSVQAFYEMEVLSAKEAYDQLKQIYAQNLIYFQQNTDEQINMLRQMYAMEQAMAEDNIKQQQNSSTRMNHTGFGMGIGQMGLTVAQFHMESAVIKNFMDGITQLGQASAGLQQVFGQQIKSQQDLNDITNQFIGIAQKYGASVDDVVTAAKLWGRQYKDLQTAIDLTNQSTLLSIVDNLNVKDANQAVESSLNAMTKEFQNYGGAVNTATKLVDSWSAVSHEASVSASDLTQGFERSAAAANNAGMSIDQLNSLIAAGVRNTGRSGAVIGNMFKSVIANIESETPKVKEAFNGLGISMTEVGANGQTQLKPVYDLLIELSQKLKTSTPDMQKYFEAIAGGKYQFDSLEASLSNTKTITDAYTASQNSAGAATQLASAQMTTFHAELMRLQDAIQKLSYDASNSNGLGAALKATVGAVTDFILGLEQLPGWLDKSIIGVGLFALAINRLRASFSVLEGAWASLRKMGTVIANIFTGNSTNGETTAIARNTLAIKENTVALQEYIATQNLVAQSTTKASTAIGAETAVILDSKGAIIATTEAQNAMKDASIANGVAQVTLAGAEEGATFATRALQGAMALLNIETGGIILAIGLAVAGITALITAAGKHKQELQQQQQQLEQINNQYNTNAKTIDNLVSKYESLSKATSNGTSFSDAKQEEDYYNTAKQLGQLLPTLVQYVDKEGKTHLQNAQFIQKEIDAQKQLNIAKQQSTISTSSDSFKTQLDAINNVQGQIDNLNKTLDDGGHFERFGRGMKYVQNSAQDTATNVMQVAQSTVQLYQEQQKLLPVLDSVATATAQQATNGKITDQSLKAMSDIINGIDPTKLPKTSQELTNLSTAMGIAAKEADFYQTQAGGSMGATQAWETALVQVEKDFPNLIDQIQQSTKAMDLQDQTTVNLVKQINDLDAKVQSESKSLSDVNLLIEKYNAGQKVSASEVQSVVKNHADLRNALIDENGQVHINIDAVTKYRDGYISADSAILDGIQKTLDAQEQALQKKLTMYGIELDSIKTIADAQEQLAKAMDNTTKSRNKSGFAGPASPLSLSDPDAYAQVMGFAKAQQAISELKSQIGKNLTSTGGNAWGSGSNSSSGSATPPIDPEIAKTEKEINDLQNAVNLLGDKSGGLSQSDTIKLQTEAAKKYVTLMTQLNQKIKSLQTNGDKLAKTLGTNSTAWQNNQKQLQSWQSQADSTAKAMSSLMGNLESSINATLQDMEQVAVQDIKNAQQKTDDMLKHMQVSVKDFDMSTWNQQMQDLGITLDHVDGKFQSLGQTISTADVRSNLSSWNASLQAMASTVDNFQSYQVGASTTTDQLTQQLENEISYANQLNDVYSQAKARLANDTEMFRQQEEALQQQITNETQSYDDQIKALQQKSQMLQDQYSMQDRITKLQQLQNQITNEMRNKQYEYINSQGQVSRTYDRSTVANLQQQMAQQIMQNQRDDMKQALQKQIDDLNNAKAQETQTLQNQLDQMKQIHQAQLSAEQQYVQSLSSLMSSLNQDISEKTNELNQLYQNQVTDVQNAYSAMEKAVSSGQASITGMNKLFYKNTESALGDFAKQVNGQIQSVEAMLSTLNSMASQVNALSSQEAKSVMNGLNPSTAQNHASNSVMGSVKSAPSTSVKTVNTVTHSVTNSSVHIDNVNVHANNTTDFLTSIRGAVRASQL